MHRNGFVSKQRKNQKNGTEKATLHNLRFFHFASDDSCNLVLTSSQGHKF